MPRKEIPILIVDDDPTYQFLIQTTLEENGIGNRIVKASDGDEALDCVLGRGKYSERTEEDIPGLIFLDLKMPRVEGFEVLVALKCNPSTQHIPVFMLTLSQAKSDIDRSYTLGANGYFTKPLQMTKLKKILKTLKLY